MSLVDKLQLWGGHLWSEGYAVRTEVLFIAQKLKNTSTFLI
jgi:hypothetical protein